MFRIILTLLFVPVLLLGGGCRSAERSSPSSEFSGPQRSPVAETTAPQIASTEADLADPTGPITLPEAAALALLRHPGLKAYAFERRVAEARKLQSGLRPNPRLKIEMEEVAGSGERSGFDAAETSIALGQLIERGGKRDKRIRVASLETELAEMAYESRRLDVLKEVTTSFVEVLAAQERRALTEQLRDLSQTAQAAVAQRVAAGKDSGVEELRAGVALAQSQIEARNAARDLVSARQRLATAWGARTPVFEKVAGGFYDVFATPALDDADEALAGNPDLARWAIAQRQRKAALELEKAAGKLDVTVTGGVQHFQETDDSSFFIGLALPIPVFNRNQGGILEATERLAQARQESVAAEIRLAASLAEALNRLAGAYDETGILRRDVLPKAQQVFEAASEGYREGKFDYLLVLDAQRTLFETRLQHIDTVKRYHLARADVERLIGQSLHPSRDEGEVGSKGTNQ